MPIITTTKVLRTRDRHDYYPTPTGLVKAAINLLPEQDYKAYDPGAGDGVWGKCLKDRFPASKIIGIDIRPLMPPPFYEWHVGDFLLSDLGTYNLFLGNPPYKFAEAFVRKSLQHVEGQVLFLLRLAFLEGQKRCEGLWKDYPPKEVHVLGRRPSFTGNGKTDATAYALFLWDTTYRGDTLLKWLNWHED